MITSDDQETDGTMLPEETTAQYFQRIAIQINTFNQLANFCGMAMSADVPPNVQLVLANPQRTTLFISSTAIMPALAALGKVLEESLKENNIDTDELLAIISNGISLATKQKGG